MDTNKIYNVISTGNIQDLKEIYSELKAEQQAILDYLDNENDFATRNRFLAQYNKIDALGEALYKYEQLIQNNLIDDANETANEITKLIKSCIVIYKWKTEPHACERCQALDGLTYYSAEDIPQRPHPNCKCKVLIEKNNSNQPYEVSLALNRKAEPEETIPTNFITPKNAPDTVTANTPDTITNETASRQQEVTELSKQLETVNFQLEKSLRQAQTQKQIIENIEQNDNTLTPEQKNKITNHKLLLNNTIVNLVKLIATNERVHSLAYDAENTLKKGDIISYIKLTLQLHKLIAEEYMADYASKPLADIAGGYFARLHNLKGAHALYKVASPNYNYNPEYIQENGKLYESIGELGNKNLQNEIRNRIRQEGTETDCKVLVLRDDSSLAQTILTDWDFTEFIRKNIDTLKKYKKVPDQTIEFSRPDLYNALHGAMVKDIRLNRNGTITLRVEDFYNFNSGRTSARGRLGERLHDEGALENYYIIIFVTIPNKF